MARPIFNRLPHLFYRDIPAISFAGMFFFLAYTQAGTLRLATDLFEKNEWDLCHRECCRALLSGIPPTERFQLLNAMSEVRAGMEPSVAIGQFQSILSKNRDQQVSAIAAYELGRLQWRLEKTTEAFDSFVFAFHTTTNKQLFLRSSCSLFLLFKDHSELKEDQDDLIDQINTSRVLWHGALFAECAKPDPRRDVPKAPIWVIRFYRSQISPAIGNRCNLEPSCSEYFHQANSKHGIKAIPMIADRLVREPSVNHEKRKPVVRPNGRIRYSDPVEDHDFWMKK